MLFLDVPVVHTPTYAPSDFTPLFIQFGAALGFVVFAMTLSHAGGAEAQVGYQRHRSWECGIEGTGHARTPISVKYFLIAILFVLFDVEVIFMYPVGGELPRAGRRGLRADDPVYGHAAGGLLLHHQKGRTEVGVGRKAATRKHQAASKIAGLEAVQARSLKPRAAVSKPSPCFTVLAIGSENRPGPAENRIFPSDSSAPLGALPDMSVTTPPAAAGSGRQIQMVDAPEGHEGQGFLRHFAGKSNRAGPLLLALAACRSPPRVAASSLWRRWARTMISRASAPSGRRSRPGRPIC